ncbi:hypothetical protein [Dokdonia sp. Asnod1-B02]|uniref:hypothetical protein n=1 Tax=Dokdonia sp. Asnod1-B02 TaxID=3160573 RepID=UPI00386A1E77
MKTTITLLAIILLLGCKNQEGKSEKFTHTKADSVKIKNTGFVDYPIEGVGSNAQLVHKDSLDLDLFWRKTAFSMLDTINMNLPNSKIKNLLFNSDDGKGILNTGGVYYAPDGLFKILVVGGELCGAYCTPFWKSELVFSNGKRIGNLDFRNIEHIYSMPDGNYLIVDKSFDRPASFYSVTTTSATLASFKEEEINYHTFNFTHPKYNEIKNNTPSKKLSFSQEHFIDVEQYLTYNEDTKKLTYSYGTDFSYCCQIDSAYVFKGEFEYGNGGFTLLHEKKEYIDVK